MIELLPPNMQTKIRLDECPVDGLDPKCWTWIAALTSRGYGSVSHGGRIWSSHKLAYELLVGAVPDGLQIDHLCKNKPCCNPAHLEAVTGKVNCERTNAAQKTRCVNGHPLVGPNLIIKSRPNGRTIRNCRVCALDAGRRKRAATRHNRPDADRRRAEILRVAEQILTEQAS
jgi:hypothetical protein